MKVKQNLLADFMIKDASFNYDLRETGEFSIIIFTGREIYSS
jgi:hypothetical protein